MKHVIFLLTGEPSDETKIFAGIRPEQGQFFMLRRDTHLTNIIQHVQNGIMPAFVIGNQTDWYDILGNIQSVFLGSDFGFQLDVIVDAAGCGDIFQILAKIREAQKRLGLTLLIRLLFLADIRSVWYEAEQKFYNEIKKDASGQHEGEDPVQWNCLYLLSASNPEQKKLRQKLLPYVLMMDCNTAVHEVRTCGGGFRKLDVNSVEAIPEELARKTVCALLTKGERTNALSVLLMGNEKTSMQDNQEKLNQLKQKMNELAPLALPSAMDLLVQKGAPEGDITATDLAARFYKDNPACNPAFYDQADIHELAQIPFISEPIAFWEERVMKAACEHGNIPQFTEALKADGEFNRIISQFRKESFPFTDKTIEERDGYSEIAVRKLESCASMIGNTIQNAVFAARLALMKARMPSLKKRLENIWAEREKAVQEALAEYSKDGAAGLIENWSQKISNELMKGADRIQLPGENEDPAAWIRENTERLLSTLPNPDYNEGRKELALNGGNMIHAMEAEPGQKLIPPVLSSALDIPLPEKWVVYQQIQTNKATWMTTDPVILRLQEWYLDLRRCEMMDQNLFQRELIAPVTETVTRDKPGSAKPEETQITEVEHLYVKKRELKTYQGTLSWVWKNLEWETARVEIYADTEKNKESRLYFTNNEVRYKPEDIYHIGGLEKLPSGVPLLIKVIYLRKGKAVGEGAQEEIHMQAPKSELLVDELTTKEGGLFKKKTYRRLKISTTGAFTPDHIAIASSSGCIYSSRWEEKDGSWISERLPDGESWRVVDRPGDLIEYEIIQ